MDEGRALNRRRRTSHAAATRLPFIGALGVVPIGALALLFVWPIAHVAVRAWNRHAIGDVLGDGRIRQIAWFSFWQATLSTVLVVLIAVPIAGIVAHYDFRGRRLLRALLIVPFTMPTVVVGAAFLALLPSGHRQGAIGIVLAHVFFNVGIMVRAVGNAWEAIDPSLSEAARTLGASPQRAWWTIVRPLLRPAIAGTAGLVFTLCFTSFGVVLLLGGPRRATIDVEIYRQSLQLLRLDRAAVLAILQVLIIGALTFVVTGRSWRAEEPPNRSHLVLAPLKQARGRWFLGAALASVLGALMLPIGVLGVRSLRIPSGQLGLANFRALASVTPGSGLIDAPLRSVWASVETAAVATALALIVGILLTLLITERRGRTTGMLQAVSLLPLSSSAVALGLGFLLAFAEAPIAWRSQWFAVPLVQSIVSLPFVVRTLVPAFRGVDPSLRQAAATLGARPWRAWRTIDARLVARPIAAAAALAAAVSIGEFGATTFLARPQSATLPVAIARLSGRPGAVLQGQAVALAVVLGALTVSFMLLAELVGTRQRQAPA